ncbi:MAG: adenylate cyclase class 1 [Moritella sp.]
MQNKIVQLKQKYKLFNELRLERALSVMDDNARDVTAILPVLLHFNHPALPGYLDEPVPSGICLFSLDDQQKRYLRGRDVPISDDKTTTGFPIYSLYAMGSTGSIGQSWQSDLDIWVCHDPWMSQQHTELLERKCSLITVWADSLNVEVNLFLIAEDKFRKVNNAIMTKESCGSAQHFLLLDEFYRSALKIAGKPSLWHILPIAVEDNYDDYVDKLVADGLIDRSEWVDLGGFPRIPAEEYFGSALWQLYKGIDSPYKAVLKTLLMEAYSAEYPDNRLLSQIIKENFQKYPLHQLDLSLDTYYQILLKVTYYLQRIGDRARLDLLRRCFYLKMFNGNSAEEKSAKPAWHKESVAEIISQWGWEPQRISHLDNRDNWKIEEVQEAHAELLDAMMKGYRNLIGFARRNNISESINPEDIGILSRKLYAAFESLPGKVTFINPQISPDLSEKQLSFVQVPVGRFNNAGWYLYNSSLEPMEIVGRKPLEHNGYLSKLVAWSYFNGLMVDHTQLNIFNQDSDMNSDVLNSFCTDLKNKFPIQAQPASNQALSRPCEIRDLAIFLNLEYDPTNHWGGRIIEFDVNTSDVFSFGDCKACLVGSIDLIYRNSWNEVRTLHFSGEDRIADALTTIMGKMHQDANEPDSIKVFCYGLHFRGLIRHSFERLVRDCITTRLQRDKNQVVKILTIGFERFGIYFERRGVSIRKLETSLDLYSHISERKLEQMPLRIDKTTTAEGTPLAVESHSSEGLVQFFFENYKNGFNVYIVDEANRVETYQHLSGNKNELIQGVHRFYTHSQEEARHEGVFTNFNLPQFYDIVHTEDKELEVIPYVSTK